MNPLDRVAALIHHKDQKAFFVGTCFAFRTPKHYITASHCLPDDIGSVTIGFPKLRRKLIASGIARHDEADLAILVCNDENNNFEGIEPFQVISGNCNIGESFLSFGYPEDFLGPNEGFPIPSFRGFSSTRVV